MVTKIIAVFIILIFVLVTAIAVWAFTRLHKIGWLTMFLRGHWVLSILSGLFVVQFLICGIALLVEAEWAVSATRYTIYLWLLYVWLYGLKKIVDMIVLLRFEKAASISQFMGRSKFFDELLTKSIELSNKSVSPAPEEPGEGHAVTDSPLKAMLDDEELFRELLPGALRKKIRRKVIGLVVQTLIFVAILMGLR